MTEGSNTNREKLLIQVLRKIPIFKGLSPSQVKRILSLCTHKQFEPGELVCRNDTPSDEMYILLSGEVAIVTTDGMKVATILPVTTVGEMGVITGQPRSATVEVTRPSAIFIVQKTQFDIALRDDEEIRGKVHRAIIDILSSKLSNDNVRLRDYQMERDRYESRISILERRLELQERRTEIAVNLAAEATDRDAEEIDVQISDQVKELVPRLLVVDDEEDIRSLVKRALPAFEVLEAENGEQALDIVQEDKLDLVITDIKMPVMDGCELLGRLRSQFPSLPVLGISGYVDADDAARNGFDGFLEKPISLHDLQRAVEQTVKAE